MRRSFLLALTCFLGLTAAGAWMAALAAPVIAAAPLDSEIGTYRSSVPSLEVNPSRIHPRLLKALVTAGESARFDIIVEQQRPEELVQNLAGGGDRGAGRAALIAGLQADAATRSAPVVELAAAMGWGETVRVFWVSPVIALQAGPELIAAMSRLDGVVQIRLDTPMRIAELSGAHLDPDAVFGFETWLPWNLELIRLDLVQPGLNLDGTGVVVANLDTGVDWTHPALQDKYRGYNPNGPPDHTGSWHVSTGENYPIPTDNFGHGTHTMGTIVGKTDQGVQIGVAPGAAWIAVKMINNQGYFLESWVHDAFEWVIAPNGDPGLAPDIINGSWGTNFPADARYQADIQALRAAGILPVFSAGNSGPFESTVGSPADYPESLAVAAVDDIALITTFSGRGPSLNPWAETKPELAAPGVDVVSSVPGGGYFSADGTSMAAPHVAGVAALLFQANPALTPDEVEQILLETAAPLGSSVPNNDTGWGLVDAYSAALAVGPHGEISGQVFSGDGYPIPHPIVSAAHSSGAPITIIAGDAEGRFTIPLAPGVYHLTVEGFGHAPEMLQSIVIHNGTILTVNLVLDPLPAGIVSGSITDAVSGADVAAVLVVVGTPVISESTVDGSYRFSLPEGTWVIEARSRDHRVGRFNVDISAGSVEIRNIMLEPAPSVLLVDSGRWYYNSVIPYFRSALDNLDYVYDVHDIRDPDGILTGASDIPKAGTLALYDLVVWSSPFDSPGLVRAGDVISEYLSLGGTLLVSGQDTAYWDAGGSLFVYPEYFPYFSGAWFDFEKDEVTVHGATGTLMEGIDLALSGPGSLTAQYIPDTVRVADPLLGEAAMVWEDGDTASLFSGGCHTYRFAWTGFGFEGAGPETERVEAFGRMLVWLSLPPPDVDLRLPVFSRPDISEAGQTITRTIRVDNAGALTETFVFSLSGGFWTSVLVYPDGVSTSGSYPVTIPGCSGVDLTSRVIIPDGLPPDVFDRLTINAIPQSEPAAAISTTLTTKTPAPLLLLDDGLFIQFGDRYAAALESLGLSYDFVSTDAKVLPENILKRYPVVIWTTGWDWFLSLPVVEQQMIVEYLRGGGRLLISSQDLLNRVDNPTLTEDYLGVFSPHFEVTPTVALAPLGDFLHLPAEAWHLDHLFVNWGDGLQPLPGAEPLLFDANMNILGVANRPEAAPQARTLFYAFPLESLPEDALADLLRAGTLWLGSFGGSTFLGPEIAAAGERITLSLRLALAESSTREGLSARVTLPTGAVVVPESVSGPWWYDPVERVLVWNGALTPDDDLELSVQLDLDAALESGSVLRFPGELRTADGQVFLLERQVVLDGPYVTIDKAFSTELVDYDSKLFEAAVTLTNPGFIPAAAVLTDTIPAGLVLVPGTLEASSGSVTVLEGVIRWTGSVEPGIPVVVTYQVEADFPQRPGLLVGYAEVWDGLTLRGDWAVVEIAGGLYFPIISR